MGAGANNKHGLWSLVSAMRGERTLDGRTREAKVLAQSMEALASALGASSWRDLSPQLQMLVRRISFKDLICGVVEAHALGEGPMEDGALSESLSRYYLAWSNSLRLDLQLVGLQRQARDVPTLEQLRSAYTKDEDGEEAAT